MNVLFIDVVGVLNSHHFCLRNTDNGIGIDESKLVLLKRICDMTNSSVVLSSIWKEGFNDDFKPIESFAFKLLELFKKYDIPIIGKTPTVSKKISDFSLRGTWKEYEIKKYLEKHKEVEHFCIIDDEDVDLQSLKDYLILTKDYQEKEEQEGLNEEHIDGIVKVLSKPRIKIKPSKNNK